MKLAAPGRMEKLHGEEWRAAPAVQHAGAATPQPPGPQPRLCPRSPGKPLRGEVIQARCK